MSLLDGPVVLVAEAVEFLLGVVGELVDTSSPRLAKFVVSDGFIAALDQSGGSSK